MICIHCDKDFENLGVLRNHIRWVHLRKFKICQYCQKEIKCHISMHENTCRKNPKNFKYCLNCGKKIESNNGLKFCNFICSGQFNNKKFKEKFIFKNDKRTKKFHCKICLKEFDGNIRRSVKNNTCNECAKNTMNKNCTKIKKF